MTQSKIQINDVSFSKLESALFHLVRGMIGRRPYCNDRESAILSSHILSLLNLIQELHRYMERRKQVFEQLEKQNRYDIVSGSHKESFLDNAASSIPIIKEQLEQIPFGDRNNIRNIVDSLDRIKRHYETVHTVSKDSTDDSSAIVLISANSELNRNNEEIVADQYDGDYIVNEKGSVNLEQLSVDKEISVKREEDTADAEAATNQEDIATNTEYAVHREEDTADTEIATNHGEITTDEAIAVNREDGLANTGVAMNQQDITVNTDIITKGENQKQEVDDTDIVTTFKISSQIQPADGSVISLFKPGGKKKSVKVKSKGSVHVYKEEKPKDITQKLNPPVTGLIKVRVGSNVYEQYLNSEAGTNP